MSNQLNTKSKLFQPEKQIAMLYDMLKIRRFEERVDKLFNQGKIYGTMHLCIGQEATAVGACSVLTIEDKITSTHRGHGHGLAKGMEIKGMMAELFGKETGYCKGKGGSMHIADLDVGNLGANGIVAAGLPLGVGAALTSKMKKLGYVVVCFFGDGATNEGAFHESLNLAAVWDLPVIFFCENNLYGLSSSIKKMTNIENIADRGSSYGIESVTINGNDVIEVATVMENAVEKARNGEGPTLIEALTYRFRGHSNRDPRKYRTREEEKEWRKTLDPIMLLKNRLFEERIMTEEEFDEMDRTILEEIEEAVDFAEASKEPSISILEEDIFV